MSAKNKRLVIDSISGSTSKFIDIICQHCSRTISTVFEEDPIYPTIADMLAHQQEYHSKWIYRYIRADREEIDMGPYETRESALKASTEHARFGAICTPPIQVAEDYVLFKG